MGEGVKIATSAPATVDVRTCIEADYERVFALYGTVFGEESLRRFRARWRWQFFENPVNARVPSQMWVAERGDEIVGFLASFPTRMNFAGEEVIIFHDCDLIVSSRARRMGVGERLVRAYDEFPNALSNALAYAPANGRIRGRVGYQPLHVVPFYYRALRVHAVLQFVHQSGRLPRAFKFAPLSWSLRAAGGLVALATGLANGLRSPHLPDGYTVEPVTEPGDEFDELWRRLKPRFPLSAVRDRRFVQWRFIDDPVFDHTVLVARDRTGTLQGYAALRVAPKPDLRVGRIMDLFCDPGATATVDTLMHGALKYVAEAHCDAVSCLGLHPQIRHRAQRYLYIKPRQLDRPAWMLWKGNEAVTDLVYDERKWHLSHADSDIGFSP